MKRFIALPLLVAAMAVGPHDAALNRFSGGMHVFGLKEGAIDYVHEGPHASRIVPEVRARVDALEQDVISGRVVIPRE